MAEQSDRGWFRFHRRIYDSWPWDLTAPQFKVFIWIIGRARWGSTDDRRLIKGQFVTIKRGEFLMSVRRAAGACGVGVQIVRDTLKIMEHDGMITRTTTQRGTIVTLNNYERYQGDDSTREHTEQHDSRITEKHTGNTDIVPGIIRQEGLKESSKEHHQDKKRLDDDFFSFLIKNFEGCTGRPPTSSECHDLKRLLKRHGPHEGLWEEAFAASHGHNPTEFLPYLAGCLKNIQGRRVAGNEVNASMKEQSPRPLRNARGQILQDSKGHPIFPKPGLIPFWDDRHMDIIGWNRSDD